MSDFVESHPASLLISPCYAFSNPLPTFQLELEAKHIFVGLKPRPSVRGMNLWAGISSEEICKQKNLVNRRTNGNIVDPHS